MSEKIKAIIVDDEELARSYLAELLEQHDDIDLVGECTNGFDAVKLIAKEKPDLVFLDIQMPKLNGFEVLELLDELPVVVFTTAYDQYAVQAFETQALDYLLKPFSGERLQQALDKVRTQRRVTSHEKVRQVADAARGDLEYLARLVIKDGGKVVIVDALEIDYIEAQDDYVNIHQGKKSWLKHQTMASLEKSLDPKLFVRIHRSILLNVNALDRIEALTRDKYLAILKDKTELPISRNGHKQLKQILNY
jgi:two-component system LytT family response regulator